MFRLRPFFYFCTKTVQCNSVNAVQNRCLCAFAPKSSEQDFLIQLKNDPDKFGDEPEQQTVDEKDVEEEKRFEEQALPSQKLRTKQYADMIKAHIRKRKIKEAIDVLEVRMKEDQVKPENYIYNLLLGACGRVGYTKKAFSLYNQMKKRALKVTGGTYTALFNACANSPWPRDGLERARHLESIMVEKMYEPNETNYHAMIKAFGRCGDLPKAFALVDDMMKRFKVNDETMNFLLQACIEDREAGFRHALLVWRKMLQKGIKPTSFTFNLMLRAIRDCGIGDERSMNNTLNVLIGDNKKSSKLLVGSTNGKLVQISNELEEKSLDTLRPNLMAKVPTMGSVISCSEITKAEDRLLLVGGFKGFLHVMAEHGCKPDIKTFTQLLGSLPGSDALEYELQKMMKKFDVRPDVDFFNMLIKKRSLRFDYDGAKAVVEEMRTKFSYRPDLITYGVLSLGCKTKEEALELIAEMKSHAYSLNIEILGAMLRQACYHKNFPYVLEIMELCLKENIKASKLFLKYLEDFKMVCRDLSNDKEKTLNKSFQKGFQVFRMRYKTWLEEVEVEQDEHPWEQFKENSNTDTRHYRDRSSRFKAKHTSVFKVKTSTKKRY